MLTAYCMKTKEKNVPMQNAVITKTSRGGYMAQGDDGKGNKMTTMLAEARALEAVKDGVAKKSWQYVYFKILWLVNNGLKRSLQSTSY